MFRSLVIISETKTRVIDPDITEKREQDGTREKMPWCMKSGVMVLMRLTLLLAPWELDAKTKIRVRSLVSVWHG